MTIIRHHQTVVVIIIILLLLIIILLLLIIVSSTQLLPDLSTYLPTYLDKNDDLPADPRCS